MKARRLIYFFFMLSIMLTSVAHAGIHKDLNQFFEATGLTSNITRPAAYHGQSAGLYTAGSLFARSPVREVSLVHINMPNYRAGCGGIDLYTGGLSFVKKDEIVNTFKSIINNAAGYVFDLALQETLPDVANIKNYMTQLSTMVNMSNINSCEVASGLVGGLWPKTQANQRHICQSIGTQKGIFTDWAAARQGCGVEGHYQSTMEAGRHDERFKDVAVDTGNIAWRAAMKNDFLRGDIQLAEIFMSLSGTLISKGEGDHKVSVLLKPLAQDEKVVDALLHGGKLSLYKCDTTEASGCLNPTKTEIDLSAEVSFVGRVERNLNTLVRKIKNDEALTTEETAFLSSTHLPVYKILNVQSVFSKTHDLLDVHHYSEIIAMDMFNRYRRKALDVIQQSSGLLTIEPEKRKLFDRQVAKVQMAIETAQGDAYQRFSQQQSFIDQTAFFEKLIVGNLSSNVASSYGWGQA